MAADLVCMPCSKDNHANCLYDVVNVATGNVVTCECVRCEDGQPLSEEDQLRAEQTYGGDRIDSRIR